MPKRRSISDAEPRGTRNSGGSASLVSRFGRNGQFAPPAEFDFTTADYVATVVRVVLAQRFSPANFSRIRSGQTTALTEWHHDVHARGFDPMAPPKTPPSAKRTATRIAEWSGAMAQAVEEWAGEFDNQNEPVADDLFGPLYLDWRSRQARHAAGEHFTPTWLADAVLTLADADADTDSMERVSDPAVGSGVFLVRAIARRWRRHGTAGMREWLGAKLFGRDTNPLAVLMARANVAVAAAGMIGAQAVPEVSIEVADALSPDRPLPQAEWVVGNPPWVNWGTWSAELRESRTPWLLENGLLDSGTGRLAAKRAKIDLAFAIFLRAAQSLGPSPAAKAAMIVPHSILQSQRGGRGIRAHFAPGSPMAEFTAQRVADFSACSPFGGSTRPIVLVLARKQSAPSSIAAAAATDDRPSVPVEIWRRYSASEDANGHADRHRPKLPGLVCEMAEAAPVTPSDPPSPWLIAPRQLLRLIRDRLVVVDAPSSPPPAWAGRAREGINTRGANAIFWLRPLSTTPFPQNPTNAPPNANALPMPGTMAVMVENDVASGRGAGVPTVRAELPLAPLDLVYPLLRGRDVRAFRATSSLDQSARLILLPHDPADPIAPIPWATLAVQWPAEAAYFSAFRDRLGSRRAFRNFRPDDPTNPYHFHGLFNVGRYTFAPHRVVWRYIAARMEAAVVAGPLGWALPVADCKLIVVACESADEAHFLAGLLNSPPIRCVVAHLGVGTQLSCHLLDRLRLPRYDADNPDHRRLVAAARTAADAEITSPAGATIPERKSASATAVADASAAVLELSAAQVQQLRDK